jgi:hypothetical protein
MEQMADAKRTRFPVWAGIVLSVALGLPLAVVALHLYIKSAETRRWEEMRTWCRKVAQEVRARDSRRPVLRGEAVPGNAWDDYAKGLALLKPLKDLRVVNDFYDQSPEADRAKARAMVELHAAAIQSLLCGAARSDARRISDWENYSNEYDWRLHRYSTLAACQARFLVEDGHPHEAMELLLDTAQYGEDLAGSDGFIGLYVLSVVQSEIKGLLSPGKLSREDCRELARELELLDKSFPREADSYSISTMTVGFDYLRKETIEAALKPIGITEPVKPTWRYGFSDRLVLVDAFLAAQDYGRRMKEAADLPWNEARQMSERLAADQKETKNPMLRKLLHIQESLSNSFSTNIFRERRAQLRLLRGAAAYRASGEALLLDDPYGDKIHSAMSGSRLKLWSAGYDGIDDGGSGGWDPRKGGKDIVLEVDR